jgi:DNA repair exonuclease SbcCD ATPase subunit
MKISQVRISNILGLAHLEFDAGKFNVISGQNGQGKTSVLEAIKSVIEGGHDATLLRKGEEKGEVVLLLDDNTEIRKRVTGKSSPVDVVQDGKKVQRPTEIIKALTDMLSVNPVEFLRARKQDRVKVLLETMPLELDTEKLSKLSGIKVGGEHGEHALAVIEAVRKQRYDDRTGTNRAVKEKDATINQLRLAMPEAPAGVECTDENQLRAQIEEAGATKDSELARIATKMAGIKSENQTKIDAIRADAQAAIDAIKAKALAEVEGIQTAERDIETKASAQREKTIQKHADTVSPISQALAAINANRDAAAKRQQAHETIKQMEVELQDLMRDQDDQNKAIDAIDAYKEELLASLPIPGLEVRDGEIYRDGVVFDRLNTEQQVGIAFDIAKLRAGDLGIICLDGMELMDTEHLSELKKQADTSGVQVFITRVTDGDFQIETE